MKNTPTLFLDSDIIINLLHKKININEFEKLTKKYQNLATTSANIYELYDGLYYLKYSKTKRSQKFIEKEYNLLDKIINRLVIYNFSMDSAIIAAEINNRLSSEGQKIGDFDCIIASIIIESRNQDILTNNIKHFSRIEELNTITLNE